MRSWQKKGIRRKAFITGLTALSWRSRIERISLLCLALMAFTHLFAQSVSRKHISGRHQHYYDSLVEMDYHRVFPLYGDRVYKKGFDIPFPFGIMVNNFYGRQDV